MCKLISSTVYSLTWNLESDLVMICVLPRHSISLALSTVLKEGFKTCFRKDTVRITFFFLQFIDKTFF